MRLSSFFGIAIFLLASPAAAHLGLDDPPSRYGANVLKVGPCGMGDGPRSENVTTYQAGATITVQWNEYINHPGHYRIAFDADGHDDFVDPACLAECDNRNMEIELYSNDAVLMDGIPDNNGGDYSVEITLPDVECDNCTLQVVQVMTDKPPYTIGGNDLYYQCADLVLVRDGGGDDMGGGVLDMGSNNTTPADMGGNNSPLPDAGDNNGTGDPLPTPVDMGSGTADTGDSAKDDPDGGCCATVRPSSSATGGLAMLFGVLCFIRRRRRISLR